MRAMAAHPPDELGHPAVRGTRVRVYVWDLVVRNTHWVIALAMAILIATGLYIAHPFGIPGGTPSPHFRMGWVRVVHFYAAIFFTLSVLVRIIWFFASPSLYARWKQFIPVQRYRRRELLNSLKFYTFIRPRPPDLIGHNPLAGLSYLSVFVALPGDDHQRAGDVRGRRAARRVHEELPVPDPRSTEVCRPRGSFTTWSCGC